MMLLPIVLLATSSSTTTVPTPEPLSAPALAGPLTLAPAADGDEPDFSYTYIEIGYYKTDLDGFDEDTDAVYGRASLGLFDFMQVFVDYSAATLDDATDGVTTGDVDGDLIGLGVGAHFSVATKLDLVGEASWLYSDLESDDFSNLDDTNNGWSAYAGARWMPIDWSGGGIEALGGFRWIDVESILSDDSVGAWEAGLRAHFLRFLSVGAKYSFLEDDERFGFDVRFAL